MTLRTSLFYLLLLLTTTVFAQTPAQWMEQGAALKKQGNYREAFARFRQAADREPANLEALFLTGWCANELQDWSTAITYLERALGRKEEGRTLFEIGYALAHQQKTAEALDRFSKALALMPEDPECLVQIANLHVEEGRHAEALSFYERYLATANPNNYYFYRAAWLENELGRYRPALAHLERYQPRNESDKMRKHGEEGFAWMRLRDITRAEQSFQHALAIDPASGVALRGLGELYKDVTKEPRRAIPYYQQAWQADSAGSVRALFHLGWLYNELGAFDTARAWLEKAVVRMPRDHDSNDELGYSLLKLKQYEEAIRVYNAGLALDPDCATGHYNLGLCYIALKRYEDARNTAARLRIINPEKASLLEQQLD